MSLILEENEKEKEAEELVGRQSCLAFWNEAQGIVKIVKDVSAETLVQETATKVRRGSIVYTDKWKGYDSLMFCGFRHLNIDHGCKFKQGKVSINGVEGFWSFAKERLIKHHGISKNQNQTACGHPTLKDLEIYTGKA